MQLRQGHVWECKSKSDIWLPKCENAVCTSSQARVLCAGNSGSQWRHSNADVRVLSQQDKNWHTARCRCRRPGREDTEMVRKWWWSRRGDGREGTSELLLLVICPSVSKATFTYVREYESESRLPFTCCLSLRQASPTQVERSRSLVQAHNSMRLCWQSPVKLNRGNALRKKQQHSSTSLIILLI